MTKKNPKYVSIDASVIGINKAIPVLESNRNQLKAMGIQLTLGKLDDDTIESYEEQLKLYSEVIEGEVAFLRDVLKLTDKQVEAVYDLDQDETIALIMQVIGRLNHVDDSVYEEAAEKVAAAQEAE